MGDRTKIDWCDASWNPVTGCLHGCEYCYARRIAERFSGHFTEHVSEGGLPLKEEPEKVHVLDDPFEMRSGAKINGVFNTFSTEGKKYPYPFGFDPTFHRYRLEEPQKWKKPRNIFVCSMADLFGDWVPDDTIKKVFDACMEAPQHRYLFLTKNPMRYVQLTQAGILQKCNNFWYGTSIPTPDTPYWWSDEHNNFASVEPILEPFDFNNKVIGDVYVPGWIIVGAETGNRKGKVIPKKDWLDGIMKGREKYGYAVFMKESLREIMGADFIQEYPWDKEEI